MKSKPPSELISQILAPALRLWLRSQVERVEDLEISISGGNRQILGGYIPNVTLAANHAVYQGLHVSQLQFAGNNIRINLPQVLKGKPLRLLETVTVAGEVLLKEGDLQASLSSSLLAAALKEHLLFPIIAGGSDNLEPMLHDWEVIWHTAIIGYHQLTFEGRVTNLEGNPKPIRLLAKLELVGQNTLRLYDIELNASPLVPSVFLEELTLDLGSDVSLELLEAVPGQLCLRGGVSVISNP